MFEQDNIIMLVCLIAALFFIFGSVMTDARNVCILGFIGGIIYISVFILLFWRIKHERNLKNNKKN